MIIAFLIIDTILITLCLVGLYKLNTHYADNYSKLAHKPMKDTTVFKKARSSVKDDELENQAINDGSQVPLGEKGEQICFDSYKKRYTIYGEGDDGKEKEDALHKSSANYVNM